MSRACSSTNASPRSAARAGASASTPGGYRGAVGGQFRFTNGAFRCGQVNILMALTDIGPGDGGTMVIPGSHKSNLAHPDFGR